MLLFEGPDAPADLRKQIPGPEFQKVLVDSDHDSVVLVGRASSHDQVIASEARQSPARRNAIQLAELESGHAFYEPPAGASRQMSANEGLGVRPEYGGGFHDAAHRQRAGA
jgi:hypothetical protein